MAERGETYIMPARDATGQACVVWQTDKLNSTWSPSAWYVLDCDVAQSGRQSCMDVIRALLDDEAIEVRGKMMAVATILLRVSRILESMASSRVRKDHLASRCLIRLHRGEPAEIGVRPTVPHQYWPASYRSMAERSFNERTYVPAKLVWAVYATAYGMTEMPTSRWLRKRFNKRHVSEYVDPFLGLRLEVQPRVFIPDPAVVDLLIGAYLSPGSPLKADLAGASVLEPCTGCGILGIAAAVLGASTVASSDVDEASISCAQRNVERSGLGQRIRLEWADGMAIDRGEGLLLTNPPWYDSQGEAEQPDYYRRCLEDPERRLLGRLLREARERHVSVGYVFAGAGNLFRPEGAGFVGHQSFAGWWRERVWKNSRGVRLHRLLRD